MKYILALCILLGASISVYATDITITATTQPNFNASNLPSTVSLSSVTTTNASATVSCSACFRPQWVGLGGFRIRIVQGGDDAYYTVSYVTSTSSLTLTAVYAGGTGSAAVVTWYPYVEMRFYSNTAFQPLGAAYIVQPGTPGSSSWFKRVAASILNVTGTNTLYIPELSLPATTDSPGPTNQARYVAGFYRPDGSLVSYYACFTNFAVPATTPTTWTALCAYNSPAAIVPPTNEAYTKPQIDARFPSCTADEMLYFAATGNTLSCLTVGSGLTISGGTISSAASSNLRNAYNAVEDYGAVGDGVTNDTTALQNCIDASEASGGLPCYIKAGTYLTDGITIDSNSVILIGDGRNKTIIQSRTNGALITLNNTATYTHSTVIRDMTLYGYGSGAGNYGITTTGSLEPWNMVFRNLEIENFGASAIYFPQQTFTTLFEMVEMSVVAGGSHVFDIFGSNTVTLMNTYVHNVATGKAGYRIRAGQATLISANGIDSGTNADWGQFGNEIADGDATDNYFFGTFINCNVEAFTNRGMYFKTGSFGSFQNVKWLSPASGTVTAIWYNYLDNNQKGIFDAASNIELQGTAAWTGGYAVHSNGSPFLQIGNQEITEYYDTAVGAALTLPAQTVQLIAGTTDTAINFTRARTPVLELGVQSTTTGQAVFRNATNGNSLTLQAGATGSNLTFTLPTADSSGSQCLASNGSGVLSWTACSGGGGTPGGSTGELQWNNGGSFDGVTNSVVDANGVVLLAPAARASGTGYYFALQNDADTGITSSSEAVGIYWDLSSTRTWDTVGPATQRETRILAPAYASSGATTITNAATLGLGAPTAGANMTLTNSYALWIEDGHLRLGSGTSASELRFFEPSGSGSNYTAFKAQAQAGNVTYTLPAADGTNGYVLTTNGGGTLSWAAVSSSAALTATYVGYGDGSNLLTGENTFTYDATNNIVSFVKWSGAGLDLDTDTNNTAALVDGAFSIIKDDGNLRTFHGVYVVPTLNTGASNLQTTLNIISVDTVNSAVTGLTTNLINLAYGGTTLFTVTSGGHTVIGGAATASELRLYEPSGSGTNYTAFKAQAQGANITYTLPAADGTSGYVLSTNGSGTLSWIAGGGGLTVGTTAIASGTAGRILYETSGNVLGEIAGSAVTAEGAVTLASSARTSGVAQYFRVNTPADTTLTASTESVGVYIGGDGSGSTVTRQWSTGALTTQREYVFVAPTYAFAGASTLSEASTVAITGAPIAGTNATITNKHALYLDNGGRYYQGYTTGETVLHSISGTGTPVHTVTIASNTGYQYVTAGGIPQFNIMYNNTQKFKIQTGPSTIDLGAHSNHILTFINNNVESMRLTTNKALLIGSTTENAQLYAVSGSASRVGLRIDSASTPTADIAQFTNNGTTKYAFYSDAAEAKLTQTGASGATNLTGMIEENVTLSTGGATTDTSIQIPANSFVLSVSYRITTTIAGVDSTDIQLGDASTAIRFRSGASALTSGTTGVGLNQLQGSVATDATGPIVTSATAVRITLSGGADNTPSAGAVRITIHYITLTASTS